MWLTGWLLSFIPDSFFIWVSYMMFGAGCLLYLLSKTIILMPYLRAYKLPAELLGIALLTVGSYVLGSYSTEIVWKERVKELETKIALAEEKSKEKNVEIRTKIVEKIKEVKVVQEVVKNMIVEKEKIVDAQCKVSPEAIDILNLAAVGPVKEEKK